MSQPKQPFTIRLKPLTVQRIRRAARQYRDEQGQPLKPHTWLADMVDDLMKYPRNGR